VSARDRSGRFVVVRGAPKRRFGTAWARNGRNHYPEDPLPTTKKVSICRETPLADSNRRPPPYHPHNPYQRVSSGHPETLNVCRGNASRTTTSRDAPPRLIFAPQGADRVRTLAAPTTTSDLHNALDRPRRGSPRPVAGGAAASCLSPMQCAPGQTGSTKRSFGRGRATSLSADEAGADTYANQYYGQEPGSPSQSAGIRHFESRPT
jgi:hypothetical protein